MGIRHKFRPIWSILSQNIWKIWNVTYLLKANLVQKSEKLMSEREYDNFSYRQDWHWKQGINDRLGDNNSLLL